MKRLIFLLIAIFFVAVSAAHAQTGKPKAAVYIMGNPEGRDALRAAVNTFLIKSGRYQMVAVDAIDVVAKEHKRQMDGSVSDAQIAKLGLDAGAEYVCVVERTELDGISYVTTRMVSVESKVAEFADMVKLPKGGDVLDIIRGQIGAMLWMEPGARTSSTQSAPPSTPSYQQSGEDGVGMFTDSRDGKVYKTVGIGGKKWMAENLNYQPQSGKSWCYGNDNSNCDKFGRLYDWNTARTVCPSRWHLPSRVEWGDLTKAVGGTGIYGIDGMAGKKLKTKNGWNSNGNGTDDYGFSALPSGSRGTDGSFYAFGDIGRWWTATEYGSGSAYFRFMTYDRVIVDEYNYVKGIGFSVRCIQD